MKLFDTLSSRKKEKDFWKGSSASTFNSSSKYKHQKDVPYTCNRKQSHKFNGLVCKNYLERAPGFSAT